MLNIIGELIKIVFMFFIAILLNFKLEYCIITICIYAIIKILINKYKPKYNLHYKKTKDCLIWSIFTYLSLCKLTDYSILTVILLTTISAMITTKFCDIKILMQPMWDNRKNEDGSRKSKHDDVIEYVQFNQFNEKLIKYEEVLKNTDNKLFIFYNERFKQKIKPTQIAEKYKISTTKLTEELDKIAFAIRLLKNL